MLALLIVLAVLVVLAAALALAVALLGSSVPPLPVVAPHPAASQEQALAKLAAIQEAEGPDIAPACRTQLLRPQGPPRGTIVVWHGFTACPAQFAEVSELLCAEGFFVLIGRLPHHGQADRLGDVLKDLTAEEIVEFAHRCIDIAAGLPGPLYEVGLSAGGALACFMGAERSEVDRLVAISPFVEPKSVPGVLGRFLVRVRSWLPRIWLWWDPVRKQDLGIFPHMYPGFPLSALLSFMHIGEYLQGGQAVLAHPLERAVLVTNPGDFAIHRGAARAMFERSFAGRADEVLELTLSRDLGWWHDFVDQQGLKHGTPDEVTDLILAGLGLSDDQTVGGIVASIRDVNAP